MKIAEQLADRELVAMARPSSPVGSRAPARRDGDSSDEDPELRCSVDPMAPTDRYRLVTPLFLSSREF